MATGPKSSAKGMVGRLVILIVLAQVGTIHTALRAQVAPYGHPDRLGLLQTLGSGDYEALEAIIARYHEAARAGRISDVAVFRTYGAFENSDPNLLPHLDRWVASRSRSAIPWIARGFHYRHLTWAERGSRVARKTSNRRFTRMRRPLLLAVRDLEYALQLDPGATVAHAMLINVSTAAGPSAKVRERILAAWTAAPDSAAVAHQTLRALQPKWHGNIEQMKNVITRLRRRHGQDHRFQWLYGFISHSRAEGASAKNDEARAVALMDEALRAGLDPLYLHARGRYRGYLGLDGAALQDFEEALSLLPHDPLVLESRAWRHRKQNHLGRALEDLNLAVALDVLDPLSRARRAELLDKLGYPAQALDDLNQAMTYGHDHAWIRMARAALLYRDKRYAEALPDYRAAVALEPNNTHHRYWLSRALDLSADCELADSGRRYLAMCRGHKTGTGCTPTRIATITEAVAKADLRRDCPRR